MAHVMKSKPRVKLVRNSNGNVSVYVGSSYDSQHYGKADLADRVKRLVELGHAPPKTTPKVKETRRFGVLVSRKPDSDIVKLEAALKKL